MGQVIELYGPYGSKMPENYHIQPKDGERIIEIMIRHCNIVDAIGFTIAKPHGGSRFERLGGYGGNESKILLKDGESLTRISGTYGYCIFREQHEIASLKIYTNFCPEGYGPFGKSWDVETAYPFSSPDLSNSLIVGFFGRHNNFLLSIGVIMRKQAIERIGPYGSQLAQNYVMQLEDGESIKEVIIRHGSFVDAVGFMTTQLGGGTTTKIFGGNGGEKTEVVLKDGEYLTKISGKHGCDRDSKQRMVVTLKIHTNLCPMGYGPYGLGGEIDKLCDFSSPLPIHGHIVGFFGRHGNYLESVGVMAIFKGQVIESYGPYGSELRKNCCMQFEDGERIKEVRLTHKRNIEAIEFVIAKPGKDTTTIIYGDNGDNGGDKSQIVLKDVEFLTRISGTYRYDNEWEKDCIATLKIHTNICPAGHGPYGLGLDDETALEFSSPHLIDGPIVGVFGRQDRVLESIGLLWAKGQVIESYGPYGSQMLQNYSIQVKGDERISEVRVMHGNIVNAIEFAISHNMCSTAVKFGGNGQEESKIVLKEDEFLTRISGTYGYDRDRMQEGIAALKIHTNFCPVGYGPYGLGKDVDDVREFSSPLLNDCPIVGVFGRHDDNLESIGVLLKKFRSSHPLNMTLKSMVTKSLELSAKCDGAYDVLVMCFHDGAEMY